MGGGKKLPKEQRPRLLLVEDDTGVRRSLQLLLQAQGLEVRAYADATRLLADASALSAQCLVADYRMDEIDGIALTVALRERGWTGHAILITGFPAADIGPKAEAANIAAVLEKPFHDREMVETIRRVMGV